MKRKEWKCNEKNYYRFVLICSTFLVSCNKAENKSENGLTFSSSESDKKDIKKQKNNVQTSKEAKANEETVNKPNPEEILDIYSSIKVGNVDRNLLSVRQENADEGIDIAINTANGYVHSYFEGDYIIFQNKTLDDKIVGTSLKYNYVTKSDLNTNDKKVPNQDELLDVFADNFMIEKYRLSIKDKYDNDAFTIEVEDFEAEVEVSINENIVTYKIINYRGELVDTIIYDLTTKSATFE